MVLILVGEIIQFSLLYKLSSDARELKTACDIAVIKFWLRYLVGVLFISIFIGNNAHIAKISR